MARTLHASMRARAARTGVFAVAGLLRRGLLEGHSRAAGRGVLLHRRGEEDLAARLHRECDGPVGGDLQGHQARRAVPASLRTKPGGCPHAGCRGCAEGTR